MNDVVCYPLLAVFGFGNYLIKKSCLHRAEIQKNILHVYLVMVSICMVDPVFAYTYADCKQGGGLLQCVAPEREDWSYYHTAGVVVDNSRYLSEEQAISAAVDMVKSEFLACTVKIADVLDWDNPRYYLGQEIYNKKYILMDVAYSVPECGQIAESYPKQIKRERRVECPSGFAANTETGYQDFCFKKEQVFLPKNLGRCPGYACCIGNPVNQGVGNKFQEEIDRNAGRLRFSRMYNSKRGDALHPDGAYVVGDFWLHSYENRVVTVDAGYIESIYLYRSNGRILVFHLSPSGVFSSDADVHGRLVEVLEGGERKGFAYHRDDDVVENYNSEGRLVRIDYPNGYNEVLEYGVNNRLDRVVSSTGEYLSFKYGLENRLIRVDDNFGIGWEYRYDALGNLEYVDNPDGTTKRYHYENNDYPHALTGITDERGVRYANWEYDSEGRSIASYHGPVTSVLNDRIEGVSVQYNSDGTRVVTNSNGNASTYSTAVQLGVALVTDVSGPGCSTCGSSNSSYQYDPANNNLLSKTENGITVQYGNYDDKGQYGYEIEAVGTPEERRVDYTYDPRFYDKITSITEPSVYPGYSKVTTRSYDEFGNMLTESVAGYQPDGVPVSRVTTYTYGGPLRQLSKIDGPRTDVNDFTFFRYYPNDPGVPVGSRARLREVEDANGMLVRSNIQYSATGKVVFEQRPNGLTISYTYYPGSDRLESLTESEGSVSRVTRWTYLPTGEVEAVVQAYGTPEASTVIFGYDDARRLVRLTDGLGNYISYELDTEGNKLSERIYDAAGVLRKTLTQAFDMYNRLDATSQVNESKDYDFAPDGTLDLEIDGKGSVTDYSYDALRRLTSVAQDTAGLNAITQYDYDSQDNLVRVQDPNDGVTTYTYDDLGNLISQTSPDTGTTSFSYDAAGNLLHKADAKGQNFYYSYDALSRLLSIDAPAIYDDINYTYDTCTNGYGRVCSVARNGGYAGGNSGNSTLYYSYNAHGEVESETQSVNTWTGYQQVDSAISYTYDAAGRVKTMVYPSGAIITHGYDAAGQLISLDLDQNGVMKNLLSISQYMPFGAPHISIRGNGTEVWGYFDQAYRSTFNGHGAMVYDYKNYDANGNVTLQYFPGEYRSNNYDSLNRLDLSSGDYGFLDYGYDLNGNRLSLAVDGVQMTISYAQNSNRLSEIDAQPVSMDANGNIIDLRGMQIDHTADNRVKSIVGVSNYVYNGLGQRAGKEVKMPGFAGQYGYYRKRLSQFGRNGELLVELGSTGQVQREYIYANGALLAVLDHAPVATTSLLQSADMDGDGDVGVEDFIEWLFNVFNQGEPGADVNGDGLVDSGDTNAMYGCAAVQNSCEATDFNTYIYYVHNDHLGTPLALTDEAGRKVWDAVYDPYGRAAVSDDPDGDGNSVALNIRFPGQYYDAETGLHYNYYRTYDPETGRYVTSDPIGILAGQDLNTYSYVGNNPLGWVDPLGLRRIRGRGGDPTKAGSSAERYGVFGCIVGCLSYAQGDSEAQASVEPTIGGGVTICNNPKKDLQSCDTKNENKKGCGIYDPNCDNTMNWGVSPPGKVGAFISFTVKEDGSVCVNVGPHAGLPGPSIGLGGISE